MKNNIGNKYNGYLKNSTGDFIYYRNHGRNGVVPILHLISKSAFASAIVLSLCILCACTQSNNQDILNLETVKTDVYQELSDEMTNEVIDDENGDNKNIIKDEKVNPSCPDDVKKEENSQKENEVYVYVCGSVVNPDVYVLTSKDHIKHAIDLAGGFREDADINVINLAARVSDGMKIYVPRIGEEIENTDIYSGDLTSQDYKMTTVDNKNGFVNINTASKEELMTLPGIGEGKATKIIDYRESNGPFCQITDICNVSGIKEGAFNKIKDRITVG